VCRLEKPDMCGVQGWHYMPHSAHTDAYIHTQNLCIITSIYCN